MNDPIRKRARYVIAHFGEQAPSAAHLLLSLARDCGDDGEQETWELVRFAVAEILGNKAPVRPWELGEAA
jgi:hypothetical protein